MIIELQSRLAARVFSGKHQLPSPDFMREWIAKQRAHTQSKTGGKFMVNI